jgi:hypothetical protein
VNGTEDRELLKKIKEKKNKKENQTYGARN